MAPSATTSAVPTSGPTVGGDEFDDLFDYDIGDENDLFSGNYNVPGAKETTKETANLGKSSANLGIDEEIEVTRKPRAPRVKLDEHRLLSANGIPKLRKKAQTELKLKGKGHEYSDAGRLLAFYQLWLDDLFPKARFLDALAMVEKMGHKKMLQTARMEWIDEGKPKASEASDTLYDDSRLPTRENGDREDTATQIAPIFAKRASERPKTPVIDVDAEMEDLYDATPRSVRRNLAVGVPGSQDSLFGGAVPSIFGPKQTTVDGGGLEDDELDALLAEEDALQAASAKKKTVMAPSKTAPADNFDDEMEAMAEMEGMW